MSEEFSLTPAMKQCGVNASIIIMRQIVMRIAATGVDVGKLVMFGDYAVEGHDRKLLVEIDHKLHELLELASELEQSRLDKHEGPTKNQTGL